MCSTLGRWQMKAVSTVEPSHLVQCSHRRHSRLRWLGAEPGANDTGMINMLFEFERQACVDIYSLLIATGLELSPSGHLRFT